MDKDSERTKSFTRRALFTGAVQGGLLAMLGGRLAWLQIMEGQRYKTLADNNRINIKMILPSRGRIVDRYGVPLAQSGQNFRVLVIPEQTDDLGAALSRLQKLIPLSQRDIQKAVRRAEKSPSFTPIEVRENLNWEEVAAVEVNLPDLPGVFIDEGEIRSYPMTDATAHLVGYVGAAGKAEQESGDPVLTLPGFMVGKTGLEKFYDPDLRGRAGAAQVEVNVLGREVRELDRTPGVQGKTLTLAIDAELQSFMQRRLADSKSASAVVMDAVTGAVYALTSFPAFDPNLFTRGLPADRWEQLLADPGLPLNNKAVGGQYPPGSTFKMVTALAALEAGIIDARTTAYCPGHFDMGETRFHCWKRGGHGTVDVVGALRESCDVFFYRIATEIGIDRLAACAEKLGLGAKFGFELPEERPGLMPTKKWKMGKTGKTWHPGETVNASIGQGHTLATPLQLAVMTARLVNGGRAVRPWLTGFVGARSAAPTGEWPVLPFSAANLELVGRGMRAVISDTRGTAHASRLDDESMQMGGKTGTAQVQRITRQQRLAGVKNEDLPWLSRHHALFVGYAPVASPRYVCSVVVEHGGGGSVAAAPVARDILRMTQLRNPAAVEMVPGDTDSAATGRGEG